MSSGGKVAVLHEDGALVVVAKAAGVATAPAEHAEEPSLYERLRERYGALWVVHRIDAATSGVVAFARTAEAHRDLSMQFEERAVDKRYHALVQGAPRWETETIDEPLRPGGDRKHRTVVDERQGKPSHTELRVVERFAGYSLLEAVITTGRRHQIRAHLRAAGYPVVGDELYGGRPLLLSAIKRGYRPPAEGEHPLIGRPALHAWRLGLRHPESGAWVQFEAEYPQDLNVALKQLRRWAAGPAVR